MTNENKNILIGGIINKLNEVVKSRNKKLVMENLHSEQTPLHGSDTYLSLIFKSDTELNEIATLSGL